MPKYNIPGLETITLEEDVMSGVVVIHAGSTVSVAKPVADDWRARGYAPKAKKRGRPRGSRKVDASTDDKPERTAGDGGGSQEGTET